MGLAVVNWQDGNTALKRLLGAIASPLSAPLPISAGI